MFPEIKQTTLANKVPHGSRINGRVRAAEKSETTSQFRRIVLSARNNHVLKENRNSEAAPSSTIAGLSGRVRYL